MLLAILLIFFFFFKKKTAYEIKECDWSSDVCSSDLLDRISQYLQQQLRVVHCAGDGTDVVERPCQRNHILDADASIGRFETDDAALRRGQAYRAGGIGTQRGRAQTGGDCSGGATTRTPGHMLRIPRIAYGSELHIRTRAAVGELVQVGLAENDRASLPQPGHDRRLPIGNPIV